jgi:hypothetical protein
MTENYYWQVEEHRDGATLRRGSEYVGAVSRTPVGWHVVTADGTNLGTFERSKQAGEKLVKHVETRHGDFVLRAVLLDLDPPRVREAVIKTVAGGYAHADDGRAYGAPKSLADQLHQCMKPEGVRVEIAEGRITRILD